MAIINSYTRDTDIKNSDVFIGTKFSNRQTVNFTAQTVADYLNINGKISIAGQMLWKFVVINPGNGTMSFEGGGGEGEPFEDITELILSKTDGSGQFVNIFLDYLVDTQILLSQQSTINQFGHYKIVSYAVQPDPNFYKLTLEFIGGNGGLIKDAYYDMASFSIATGSGTIPTLQEVTTAGATTTNPILAFAGLRSNEIVALDSDSLTLTAVGTSLIIDNATETIIAEGNIVADRFIKLGGTSSQFLKADGTVDSTAYQTALGFTPENVTNKSNSYTLSSTTTYPNTKALVDGLATKADASALNNYIPLSGTTVGNPITGDIEIKDPLDFGIRKIFTNFSGGSTGQIEFSDETSINIKTLVGDILSESKTGSGTIINNVSDNVLNKGSNIAITDYNIITTVYENITSPLTNQIVQTPTETTFNKPIQVPELKLYNDPIGSYGSVAVGDDHSFSFKASASSNQFDILSVDLTAPRFYYLPDASGTIALTSDIPSIPTLQQVTTVGASTTNIVTITSSVTDDTALTLINSASNGAGVTAFVNGGFAVAGYSNFSASYGVYGANATDGIGVEGTSGSGIAISGKSFDGKSGVFNNLNPLSTSNIVEFQKDSVLQVGISHDGEITANKFIKELGVSAQFLKADGSVDNNVYLTSADLPSTLDLFATTTADTLIPGYTVLVRNILDPRYNTVAIDVPTGDITTTNQLLSSLITDTNVISGEPGVFNFTTIGNIRRVSGSGEATFYFRIYKRSSLGVETFIAQSDNTLPVVDGGLYVEFSAVALWNDGLFLSTDRIVVKYYANRISGGSNPSYEFQFGGLTPVRSTAAVPVSVLPNIYLSNLVDVEDVPPLPNEILYWNDTANLWEHSLVNDLLVMPTLQQVTTAGNTSTNNITANGFIKSSGTSSQFLKADGSVDSNTYLTSASNYWTKTGDDIKNNNIGNTQIQIQPTKQTQFLNSAGTQVGFIDENGTYRAGTATQYVTVGLLGGNTWMSMVRLQASMGVILGNPQVNQAFTTTSTNYFGSSYIAGSSEVAAVANAEHSFNIGNAPGDGITSGIFRIGRTRLQSTVPVKYATDLSASYDARTLIDKGYADATYLTSLSGAVLTTTNQSISGTKTFTNQLNIDNAGGGVLSFKDSGLLNSYITGNGTYFQINNFGTGGYLFKNDTSDNVFTISNSGNATFLGSLTTNSFIKSGGTSSQYLMADGSVTTGGGSGTVTSVAALTIGTTGTDLSSTVANSTTTPVITLNVPTASASNRGALSSADWSTFNGKQNAITAAALTKVDDTNVTLTLGGSPTTALLQATSLTLGWTGTLADGRIASAATWNAKQNALSGTGFVKISGTTISYDNSTYLTSVGIANLTATGTPSATTYLRGDNTWATVSGGGTPGGTVNEVQYNDGVGGFAGAANIEVSSGNLKLISTTDPTTPTGGLIYYSKVVGGRVLPKIIGPSGIDTVMQVGLHGNSVFMVAPSNATTAPTIWGGVLTTATTISHQQTIASANLWQATRRTRFQTSTTAGNVSGMRTSYVQWYRGSVSGFGGFWFRCQLGMNINLQGGQKFVGLCQSPVVLTGDPSALTNMCGMGYDAADLNTGSWSFMYNDGTGTATKVNLGANALRNTNDGYDLIMYMAPGGSELFVRITNIQTNVVVLETSYTTLLPVANTGMAFKAEVRNGAIAAADNIEIAKVYIETDY